MIKLIKTQCPNCGAQLTIQNDWKYALCNYCGNKLIIDEGTIRVESHIYDEAKLKEIDIREKEKQRREKQINREKQMWQEWGQRVTNFLIVSPLLIYIYMVVGYTFLRNNDKAFEDYEFFGVSIWLFLSFGYIALLVKKKPKNTLYSPNTLFSRYGAVGTYFIIIGILFFGFFMLGLIVKAVIGN